MGKVKDIYIRYEQGGDMFVRRALSGLPLLLAQFSASPVVFNKSESAEVGITTQWILSATKAATFPMMIGTPVIGNIAEFFGCNCTSLGNSGNRCVTICIQ